jgi:hypothetical protein
MNVHGFHTGSYRPRRRLSRDAIQYGCAWLILVVALSGLSAQQAETVQPTGPRIEFDSKEADLGTLDRGQVVTARFSARNVSDQPVRILRVKPG